MISHFISKDDALKKYREYKEQNRNEPKTMVYTSIDRLVTDLPNIEEAIIFNKRHPFSIVVGLHIYYSIPKGIVFVIMTDSDISKHLIYMNGIVEQRLVGFNKSYSLSQPDHLKEYMQIFKPNPNLIAVGGDVLKIWINEDERAQGKSSNSNEKFNYSEDGIPSVDVKNIIKDHIDNVEQNVKTTLNNPKMLRI